MRTEICIQPQEYKNRQRRLVDKINEAGCSVVVLFDRDYILYYSGFAFIPTERPIILLLDRNGQSILYVPFLEKEHASSLPAVDQVIDYPEYPSRIHPMERFGDILGKASVSGCVAADQDGYPDVFGYNGPTLSDLLGHQPLIVRSYIEECLAIKSPTEVRLIVESVRWGHLAHTLLQRYTRVGLTETEVSLKASAEATKAMLDTIGPLYRSMSAFNSGAHAGYRGQIGRNAAIPHALAANITFADGDVLVSGAGAVVWGYYSELERTMIIGEPSNEQRELFTHMLNLQNIALNAIKPGIPCSAVDEQVRNYYDKHHLWDYWKHHTGHAIGLRYHEGPFLDIGDERVIEPGMVFTIEPGLYVDGIGGFRHSDTVLVRETGIERLTYYPRELETLIING